MTMAVALRASVQIAARRHELADERLREKHLIALSTLPNVAGFDGFALARADEADLGRERGSVRCIADAQDMAVALPPARGRDLARGWDAEREHHALDVLAERLGHGRPA